DGGENSERGRASAARLHAIKRAVRCAEEAASFGLPPSVDDSGFAFANDLVIPAPNFRFDGFADRGHMLVGIVVFLGCVGAGLAEHSNGGGRGVEDVDAEALGDAPGTSGVRKLRYAFV